MRIMRFTAVEAGQTTESAIDLDSITFAHADGENTLVYTATDLSIRLAVPFEVFVGYWGQDKVVSLPSPALARVIKGEA